MPATIMEIKPAEGLTDYLRLCRKANPRLSLERVYNYATDMDSYLSHRQGHRHKVEAVRLLDSRWYAGLARGVPDFSIYNCDEYLGELWAGWLHYSRQYLRDISLPKNLPPTGVLGHIGTCKRVADLGCGFGYTTAALGQLFQAQAIGTNLEGTVQMKVCREVGRRYGCAFVGSLEEVPAPVDVVFASEYFEHFQQPLAHLREVVRLLRPRALLIANTFTQKAAGHFDSYAVDDGEVPGAQASRLFNRELRKLGYIKIKTRCWNNRPAYWSYADGR